MINKGFSFRFFDDNSEDVNYTEENLPIRSVISVQEDYPTLCVVNHWHNDFEFSYVMKGHIKMLIIKFSVIQKGINFIKACNQFTNSYMFCVIIVYVVLFVPIQ